MSDDSEKKLSSFGLGTFKEVEVPEKQDGPLRIHNRFDLVNPAHENPLIKRVEFCSYIKGFDIPGPWSKDWVPRPPDEDDEDE